MPSGVYKRKPGWTNQTSFKKGQRSSPKTEFKKGENTRENHHNWSGGIYTTKQGYVMKLCPDHPSCSKTGYVQAHRYIMEKHIKRLLNTNEAVHHINGIKNDNRIENLKLMIKADHKRLHHSLPVIKKGQTNNTGRTHFKKGHIPWNKKI